MEFNNLPDPGTRIGVAVSGGADSTALLLLLHELDRFSLSVVHVNHGLRGADSDADEAFCRDLAERFSIPFHCHRVSHAEVGNLEEDARNVRLAFFRSLADQGLTDCVATAHTRDDQAETVLFRLLRGAHLTGLAGILPAYEEGWLIRPLLHSSRASLRQYLEGRGETWREDASNGSLDFRRNRIRHQLLPLLEREWNPEIVRALAQTADLAREDEEFWKSYTNSLAERIFTAKGNSRVVEASNLLSQPVAVARRLVRWVLERTQIVDTRQIEYKHVEAVLALARLAEGHGRVILPGADVMRSFEWLRFAPWKPGGNADGNADRLAARNVEVPMRVPGEATAPDGSRVRVSLVADGPCGNDTVKASDGLLYIREEEEDRVVLRSWKPGDRYQPLGNSEPLKVKTLFQERRIPLWERAAWPIITIGDRIVWAREFGPACERASNSGTSLESAGGGCGEGRKALRIERIE